VNSGAPEGLAVPAPLVTIFVVLLIYVISVCGIGTHTVFKPHQVSAKDND